MAALKARGLRVQAFKVGPDYLDPSWHRLATGRVSYNLDTWMLSRDYVRRLFEQKTSGADIAIIEGVMGLFDGASTTSLEGSTAEIASLLAAPVLLVADATGAGRSFAAGIKGFSEFEPDCQIAGVIANYCGSSRHATMLQEALAGAGLCDLAGWFTRDAFPTLPSRHLGLQAPGNAPGEGVTDALGLAVQTQIDMDKLYRLADRSSRVRATSAAAADAAPVEAPPHGNRSYRGTVAIAMDQAFSFYYPDNLELLQELGLRVVTFSPLHDADLPEDIDGLILGGGYPEEHARQLSENHSMLRSILRFAESDRPIYAECGGMMYLAQGVTDRNGQSWPMVGILPFSTRMLPRCKRLGYTSTVLTETTLLGPAGTRLRGHEFHYSEIVEPVEFGNWHQPYILRDSRGSGERSGGFVQGNILASYVHQHLQSNLLAAQAFADALAR